VKAEQPRTIDLGEWTELIGTTQPLPRKAARLSAAVEGRVLWVLDNGKLTEGQVVTEGQAIVQLDDRVARANRDKVLAAQAELSEQKKQADLAQELAQIEVKRLEELTRANSANAPLVSRIELDKARIAMKEAASRQQAVLARQKAGEAEVKAIDEQLDLFTIRAPIKGRLGVLQVVPGQTLTVGAPVADVVDLDEIDVLSFVPPHITARLALDQPVRLSSEESRAKGASGKVVFIAVQAQPETGNFAAKTRFPNTDLQLRANAVARVQVLVKPEGKRLTILRSAVLEDQDPPAVVVVEEIKTEKNKETQKPEKLGKARKLYAELGIRDRERVEILELFADRDKKEKVPAKDAWFVTEGVHGLQTGDLLKLEEHKEEK
jgi:RND family efflux transporter MFP subunit